VPTGLGKTRPYKMGHKIKSKSVIAFKWVGLKGECAIALREERLRSMVRKQQSADRVELG